MESLLEQYAHIVGNEMIDHLKTISISFERDEDPAY